MHGIKWLLKECFPINKVDFLFFFGTPITPLPLPALNHLPWRVLLSLWLQTNPDHVHGWEKVLCSLYMTFLSLIACGQGLTHIAQSGSWNEYLNWGRWSSSVKGQIVNVFGFVGQRVSTATTQLCRHSVKTALNNLFRLKGELCCYCCFKMRTLEHVCIKRDPEEPERDSWTIWHRRERSSVLEWRSRAAGGHGTQSPGEGWPLQGAGTALPW